MKRKALIVITILILILAFSTALVACDPDNGGSGSSGTGSGTGSGTVPGTDSGLPSVSVTYTATVGVKYGDNPTSVTKGSSLDFTFTLGAFYEGTPVVKFNDNERTVTYDEETYTYTCHIGSVVKDSVVTIEGVTEAVSTFEESGSGTEESPFIISKPIDLIRLAEIINVEGDQDSSAMKILGYYKLNNDIDLRGEELEVIGDGSNNHAFFGGYFDGNGYSISNFTIDSEGKDYVGLFGIVQAYDWLGFTGGVIYNLKISDFTITARNTGSTVLCGGLVGQGFGATLMLCEASNGSIEIYGDDNNFSYVGGLMGLQRAFEDPYYAKISYCSTVNVDINCNAGSTFVAGGITGYVYSSDEYILSSINNCYSTGDITGAFYTGGIAGWLGNNSSIVNCYSTGNVTADTRIKDKKTAEMYCYAYAGGIVGLAQNETVVADCFAIGTQSATAALGMNYCSTGSIIGSVDDPYETGYSGYEASIYNCYTKDTINPTSASDIKSKLKWHAFDWDIVEGQLPVINTGNTAKDDDGKELTTYSYMITLNFGEHKDADNQSSYEITIHDQYEAMSFWYQIYAYYAASGERYGLPAAIKAEGNYASYSYFFDPEMTIHVPCGYVATRDVTLYVGFADYSEIADVYYVIPQTASEHQPTVTLTLTTEWDDSEGAFVFNCADPYGTHSGTYTFDGKSISFNDARFARYYNTGSIVSQQKYTYTGMMTDDGMNIFGGLYTTTDEDGSEAEIEIIDENQPLIAIKVSSAIAGSYYYKEGNTTHIYVFYIDGTLEEISYAEQHKNYSSYSGEYEIDSDGTIRIDAYSQITAVVTDGVISSIDGNAVTPTDDYRGTWYLSSLSEKRYEFDGAGNWSYYYYRVYNGSLAQNGSIQYGTYSVSGDAILLDNGYTAKINENGFLEIFNDEENYVYGQENGNYGVWKDEDGSVELRLNGISADGIGTARIIYYNPVNGRTYKGIYDLTYSTDMLAEGYICLFYQGDVFGRLVYDIETMTLSGAVYDQTTGANIPYSLYRQDEYAGEWIWDGQNIIENVKLSFNGYGSYKADGSSLSGKLSIDNGETTLEMDYVLENGTLNGYVVYEGQQYTLSYDDGTQTIVFADDDLSLILYRDNILSGKSFIDEAGTLYEFKGDKSIIGGTLTAGGNKYSYRIGSGDVVAKIYDNDIPLGFISIETAEDGRYYSLTFNGIPVRLGEKTDFTGDWAVSGVLDDGLSIGTMNLDGKIYVKTPLETENADKEKVKIEGYFEYNSDGYLSYLMDDGTTLYVIELNDSIFVLSSYLDWFNYEDSETDSDGDVTAWNYSFATVADPLRGVWVNNRSAQEYRFDGLGYNPEAMGIYSLKSLYDNDSSAEIFYYARCKQVEGDEIDIIIVNSVGAAFKVVFCEVSSDKNADQYKNADGTAAFTLVSVTLSDYDTANRDFSESSDIEA